MLYNIPPLKCRHDDAVVLLDHLPVRRRDFRLGNRFCCGRTDWDDVLRVDDLPYGVWSKTFAGSSEALNRAVARLWLTLPYVRWSRRQGIATRRMLILYALVNWSAVVVIEAVLTLVLP